MQANAQKLKEEDGITVVHETDGFITSSLKISCIS